jgi:hypothetical protein
MTIISPAKGISYSGVQSMIISTIVHLDITRGKINPLWGRILPQTGLETFEDNAIFPDKFLGNEGFS